jgi:peptide/nickel transport system substrate-binding protein
MPTRAGKLTSRGCPGNRFCQARAAADRRQVAGGEHDMKVFHTHRRALLAGGAALTAMAALGRTGRADEPVRGGTLTFISHPEAPMLTSALSTAGPIQWISGKIFDGLVTYDFDFNLVPQLATAWDVSPDGKTISFTLREGVTWHDGTPFTAHDVAYSVMQIWKVEHSRGRNTYSNVESAEVIDDHNVVLRLSGPAPYIMNALASIESQILPRHIYEGTDPQTNPANNAPIGTGPFRFEEWARGSHLILALNENYWDQPKPYLDRIIYRFIPDGGARAAAMEAGEGDLLVLSTLPLSEIKRLGELPHLGIETRGYDYLSIVSYLGFNMEREVFKDVRVRRAFAHAIDNRVVTNVVWMGYGTPAKGPIHKGLAKFQTDDVPTYGLDLDTANRLLDEAGHPRGADGIRFRISHHYLPFGEQFVRLAEYVRQALDKVGVAVETVNQDYGTYLNSVFTERDFDITTFFANNQSDPTIGVERFYWSGNFQPGVPFSNAAAYQSPAMDAILERTRTLVDEAERRRAFVEMQQLAMEDLPYVPLVWIDMVTVYNERVQNHAVDALGAYSNLASAYLKT